MVIIIDEMRVCVLTDVHLSWVTTRQDIEDMILEEVKFTKSDEMYVIIDGNHEFKISLIVLHVAEFS